MLADMIKSWPPPESWNEFQTSRLSPIIRIYNIYPDSSRKWHIRRFNVVYEVTTPPAHPFPLSQRCLSGHALPNLASLVDGLKILIPWRIAKKLLLTCDRTVCNVPSYEYLKLYELSGRPVGQPGPNNINPLVEQLLARSSRERRLAITIGC